MEGIWKAVGAVALGAAAAVMFWNPAGWVAASTAASLAGSFASGSLALGASYIADVLTEEEAETPGGVSFEVDLGGDVPRQVVIGPAGLGGHLVYANTYAGGEEPNTFLQMVFVLSDSACESVDYVWVDGKRKNLISQSITGNEHARYYVEDYSSDFEVRWFSGTYAQTADTQLVSNAQPAGRWTTSHRGSGVCYVSCTLRYDEDKFKGGMPGLFWQIKGAKLYDSREDSTNGGTGAQRFDDATTWEYRADPATAAYHYRRGFFINDQRILGMGMPAADLVASSYRAAADACDTVANGEPSYAVSVILNDDAQHADNLRSLMAAMAGYETERSGLLTCFPGASQAIAGTITDNDLAPGRRRYAAKRPRDRLANAVFGRYTEPRQQWGMEAFKPFLNSTYEAEDGGERLPVELDYSFVSSKKQAGRLGRVEMRKHRRQRNATIPVGIHLLKYEQGDWITWDSDRYGNHDYVITAITENDDDTLTWELEETASSIYAVDVLTDYTPTTDPTEDTTLRGVPERTMPLRQRILSVDSLDFDYDSPSPDMVSWSSGHIRYIDSAGDTQRVAITADDAQLPSSTDYALELWGDQSGDLELWGDQAGVLELWGDESDAILFIVWPEGDTALETHTTQAAARDAGAIIATYRGGDQLRVREFGDGEKDGRRIKRRTIPGDRHRDNELEPRSLKRHIRTPVIDDLEWSTNANSDRVTWDSTQISLPRDNATGVTTVTVSSGGFSLSGDPRVVVGWVPFDTQFTRYLTTDDAEEDGAIVMSVYRGNHNIRPVYGLAIIDGSKIRERSIRRTEIERNAITDDEVEGLSAPKLTAGHLDMERVPPRGIETKRIAIGAITKGAFARDGGEVAVTSTSDTSDLFDTDLQITHEDDGEGRVVALFQFRVNRNNTGTGTYETPLASNVWDYVVSLMDGSTVLDDKTISLASAMRTEITEDSGTGYVQSVTDRYMANSAWIMVMFSARIEGVANLNVRIRRAAASDFGFDMGTRELYVQLFER